LALGWRRFFEGWISKEWSFAQQAYYTSIKFFRTGKRWTVELIKNCGASPGICGSIITASFTKPKKRNQMPLSTSSIEI
jgi:hypothetical protein